MLFQVVSRFDTDLLDALLDTKERCKYNAYIYFLQRRQFFIPFRVVRLANNGTRMLCKWTFYQVQTIDNSFPLSFPAFKYLAHVQNGKLPFAVIRHISDKGLSAGK